MPALFRLLRVIATISPEISLPKMVGVLGNGLALTLALIAAHSSLLKPANFSNAKSRCKPGGMPASICAASARMVPEPHIGSNKVMPGFQPEVRSRPAARFSRKGASPVSIRQPRLNSASPEVSR
ncbi:hypothetical protein D3C81_1890150 [compost metagenome]